jgi:hypothetical protein
MTVTRPSTVTVLVLSDGEAPAADVIDHVAARRRVLHSDESLRDGCSLLRNATLLVPGQQPVPLPPVTPAPDVLIELPGPSLRHSDLAAIFPTAVLCRPPTRELTEPLALEEGAGDGTVLRDVRRGTLVQIPSCEAWRARSEGLLPIPGLQAINVPQPTPNVLRLLLLLDPRLSSVTVLPGSAVRTLRAIAPDNDQAIRAAFAALASDANGWKPVSDDELTEQVRRCVEDLGERMLDRPPLSGGPGARRLLPVLAVQVIGSSVPSIVDIRWSAPGGLGLDFAAALDAWLDVAEQRSNRPLRALLRLPNRPPTTEWRSHPLAPLFPTLAGECGLVSTRARPDAMPIYVNQDLRGPADCSDSAQLLAHVVRDTTPLDPAAGPGVRFVEPGVGRSYLVPDVSVAGRPDLHDFAVTGGGLTPYSVHGFVSVGSPITGRAALIRLLHRQHCALRLERCGLRTAHVLLIAALPGESAPLPDGSSTPAGLALRGFRSVLRVRQLDPVAAYYQSIQHAPLVSSALAVHSHEASDQVVRALDTYAGGFDDIRKVLWPRPAVDSPDETARNIRRRLVAEYAPRVLSMIQRRLAAELDRDPDQDPIHVSEYVAWFATAVGRQLSAWYRERFLHDYHQPGIGRNSGLVTLVESNVTLLAEFPDLDTAVFVEDDESYEALQLGRNDRELLRSNYEHFHAREVESARAVVRSLALAASAADAATAEWSDTLFDRAYAIGRSL